MRRVVAWGVLAAGVAGLGGPARAWLAYPAGDRPDHLIVEIERAAGDIVPLADLPSPFDDVFLDGALAERRSFRWRYDRQAEGLAVIAVAADGKARVTMRFASRQPPDGKRYGAAIALLDADGRARHVFYGRADRLAYDARAAQWRHSVTFELGRAAGWWETVGSLAFFRMTYHPGQGLEPRETWRAMRRAVWHVTKGAGTEQRQ